MIQDGGFCAKENENYWDMSISCLVYWWRTTNRKRVLLWSIPHYWPVVMPVTIKSFLEDHSCMGMPIHYVLTHGLPFTCLFWIVKFHSSFEFITFLWREFCHSWYLYLQIHGPWFMLLLKSHLLARPGYYLSFNNWSMN